MTRRIPDNPFETTGQSGWSKSIPMSCPPGYVVIDRGDGTAVIVHDQELAKAQAIVKQAYAEFERVAGSK